MLGFGRSKQLKPRSFNLQPRYYNERKERLDKLRSKYQDKEDDAGFDKNLYREHLQDSWRRPVDNRGSSNQLMRLVIILFVLIVIVYYAIDIDFTALLNGK